MEIEKYINSGSIRCFHPILKSWTEALERYLGCLQNEDSPWWYNERATLSSFAAAAWVAEGIALEEYSTEKGKHGEAWKGRCDLFLGIQGQFFGCEAKQVWCAVGRTARGGRAVVEAGLRKACGDARKLKRREGRRLGLCFAVPYFPDRDRDHIEGHLKPWLEGLKGIEYSCIAWSFPEETRYLKSVNGYFYPGVVLVVREVFRQV